MIQKIKTESKEEWLDLRKKYVGGSDAATVVNLNPFNSRYALWCEKTGRTEGFKGNLATEVGSYLEEFVAKKFEEESGKKVMRCNFSLVNDEYPFAIADVDRVIVGEDAGLEIKTCSALSLKNFNGNEYPANYYVQCMHYMAVTEKEKWYLAVLIGNSDFRIFEIDRNEDEIKALMENEKLFMEMVEADTPPLADGSDASSEALAKVYPESNNAYVTDLTPWLAEMREYSKLTEQIKELTSRKDEIANGIKMFLGDCSTGLADGFSVSYKTQTRTSFDEKAFLRDHKGINLDNYKTSTTSRIFRLTQKKEK